MAADSGLGKPLGAGQPQLLIPLDLARRELHRLVLEGSRLASDADEHAQNRTTYRDWHRLTADAESWSHHSRRLLRSWFSDDTVAAAFSSPHGAELSYGRRQSPSEEHLTARDLLDQVTALETLIDRLEAYAIRVARPDNANSAMAPLEHPQPHVPPYVTYNFSGGNFGQVVAGEGQRVHNINSHIAAVVGQGETQLATALQRLAEVALNDPELEQRTRTEVIEVIEDLAEAAEAKPQQQKTGRIKGAIAVIRAAAGAATQLGQAWQQWGPVITEHLRLP